MSRSVYGLCPGCLNWQVDFDTDTVSPLEVEDVIAEHAVQECPELLVIAQIASRMSR